MAGRDVLSCVMERLTCVLGMNVDRTIKPGTLVSESLPCTFGLIKRYGKFIVLCDLRRDLMTLYLSSTLRRRGAMSGVANTDEKLVGNHIN